MSTSDVRHGWLTIKSLKIAHIGQVDRWYTTSAEEYIQEGDGEDIYGVVLQRAAIRIREGSYLEFD